MSTPGTDQGGYALLDVLIALLIVAIGFGSLFVALSSAVEHSVRYETALWEGIEERNQQVDEFR